MSKRLVTFAGFIVAACVLMIGSLGTAVAQDMTGATPEAGGDSHPAHIHSGTCDTLGGVVYPLQDVTGQDALATPETDEADVLDLVSTPDADMASPDASMVEGVGTPDDTMDAMHEGMQGMDGATHHSTTDVEASLDDILAAEHAINVHESVDNIQNFVACGDITGTPDENGELVITLNELNESGLSGEATLTDNGDGTTTVEVSLTGEDGMGAPEATPAN